MNIFKILRIIGGVLLYLILLATIGGILVGLVIGSIEVVQTEGWGEFFAGVGWVIGFLAGFALLVWVSIWIGDNWSDWEKNAREKNRYIVEYKPYIWDKYLHVAWSKNQGEAEEVFAKELEDQYDNYKVRLRKGKEILKEEYGKRDL